MAQQPTPILFVAIPKKTKFQLQVENPNYSEGTSETIIEDYIIYHKGPGCPVPVVIDVEQLYIEYDKNYPTPEQRETLSIDEYLALASRANMILYRDILMTATVPQLTADLANTLANDEANESGLKILTIAGWKAEPVAMPTSEDKSESDSAQNEETPKGEDVIGE